MNVLDEYELSVPINIWEKLIYEGLNSIELDIYYNEEGYPKRLHDELGGNETDYFRKNLIEEIKKRNNTNKVWRISGDSFTIVHNKNNCEAFDLDYKGIKHKILKKTIMLKVK